MIYLSRREVEEICKELDVIALVKEVFRLHGSGQTILPEEAYLGWKAPQGEAVRSLNMPAYVGGKFQVAGTKVINSNIKNPERGLPRASGLTMLFDKESVGIACVLESAYISALRTASVSAFSIGLLANAPVRRLAIIGAGAIGAMHLKLLCQTFASLQRVSLFDLNADVAHGSVGKQGGSGGRGIAIDVAASAEEAVRAADVVVTATTVTEGYIPYAWLNPGTVVVNVSLDDLLPEVFLQADSIFVDDWNLVRQDSRRLLGKMYREGLVAGPRDTGRSTDARRIDGEIADVAVARHPGRRNPREIIIVNPFGLAIEDIAFASEIFDIATKRRIGTVLAA